MKDEEEEEMEEVMLAGWITPDCQWLSKRVKRVEKQEQEWNNNSAAAIVLKFQLKATLSCGIGTAQYLRKTAKERIENTECGSAARRSLPI